MTTRLIAMLALGGVIVIALLIWVIDISGDNDKNDGGRGLDWERTPIGVGR